jgi:hypothetical protein
MLHKVTGCPFVQGRAGEIVDLFGSELFPSACCLDNMPPSLCFLACCSEWLRAAGGYRLRWCPVHDWQQPERVSGVRPHSERGQADSRGWRAGRCVLHFPFTILKAHCASCLPHSHSSLTALLCLYVCDFVVTMCCRQSGGRGRPVLQAHHRCDQRRPGVRVGLQRPGACPRAITPSLAHK